MKKTKSKKWIPGVLLALGVVAGAGTYLKNKNSFYYSGTLEATKIDIPARVGSVVESKEVEEGQKVKSGQVLYRLAGEDIRLVAESAAKDYSRAERLYKIGSMPQEAFEHLKSKRDDSALKLHWCDIQAPMDGTILSLFREKGEWVGPGTKMLTLADLSELTAIYYVEQTKLANLSLGQKVIGILPEMGEKKFEGTISKINEEAEFTPKNVQTRTERTRLVYAIKVRYPNSDGILKPGMTLETSF